MILIFESCKQSNFFSTPRDQSNSFFCVAIGFLIPAFIEMVMTFWNNTVSHWDFIKLMIILKYGAH